MTIRATVQGSISGTTEGGNIGPDDFLLNFDDQDGHDQIVVTVEDGDSNKMIDLADHPYAVGQKQTFFMMVTSKDVQVRINERDDMTFALSEGGLFAVTGLPEIDRLEFTSLVAEEAKVYVTKLHGPSTLTDPAGGVPVGTQVDKYTATAGQTIFTLTRTPGDPDGIPLFVEGVQYSSPDFFEISGTTLTWKDVPFALPAGARVEIYYK